MGKSYAAPMLHVSYWEFFKQYYTPLLQEVDLLLKTSETPITVAETARILVMKPETIEKIMASEDIKQLDKEGVLRIMMQGDSPVCQLLQRECLCGSPDRYSPSHIAYIYGLQEDHVEAVCQENGYSEVLTQDIPDLLSKIYVFILP